MKRTSAIILAKILILLFGAILLVMLGAAPMVCRWYVGLRGMHESIFRAVLICWYACSIPAGWALGCLWQILQRIGAGAPFADQNIKNLRRISYCAVACMVLCALGALYYLPLALVAVVMGFLAAVVRVVAACFRAAKELADENSLTI